MTTEPVVIVSGLPRSGTSMMMRMLEAGGLPVLTDGVREADDDNPRGYYEFERVKRIENDREWLLEARGKVVKMISALVKHLPQDHTYKMIFLRRKMGEILASQKRMLARRGEAGDKVGDEVMGQLFAKHLKQVESWLAQQPNIDVMYVSYNDVLENPQDCASRINRFLGSSLDEQAMVAVVEPSLYRQRRQ